MNYRQTLLATALVFVTFFASAAYAADTKIGVMNVQQIVTESKAGKAARGRFEIQMKGFQDKFKADQETLAKLKAEIEKKKSVWSEDKKTEKIREYQVKGRELQTAGEESRFKLKQIQDQELEPILKALEGVVAEFGKSNGYTVILDSKSGVVYHDDSIQLTNDILKKLDAVMPK